eukprot:TRINITY_DN205_c0_g3_i1.p2 TRINITY_DN205_c0_g3~~TRINITY_DN205_c0_g3_i1.p2  ORF type:complete len:373 (-),score=29.04 TRINITY_DN205_c0_g3_i1:273-1391(-)
MWNMYGASLDLTSHTVSASLISVQLSSNIIATLISYLYFKEQKVDIAVIETGIGGRLDATNIINPLVSVITSIGLDHCEILGDTVEKIAFEKSGIIKPGKPVVLGSELPLEYLSQIAMEKGSEVYKADIAENLQTSHNAIFKKTVEVLSKKYGFNVPKAAIEYAETRKQQCRMEYVDKALISKALKCSKLPSHVILDVGHNKPALVFLLLEQPQEAILGTIKKKHKYRNLKVIAGFSQHKDGKENLKVLFSQADEIYFVQCENPRASKVQELVEITKQLDNRRKVRWGIIEEGDVEKTVENVVKTSGENDVILICGSFYIMAGVRKALGYIDCSDPVVQYVILKQRPGYLLILSTIKPTNVFSVYATFKYYQ